MRLAQRQHFDADNPSLFIRIQYHSGLDFPRPEARFVSQPEVEGVVFAVNLEFHPA
jgi:hypothetical protein